MGEVLLIITGVILALAICIHIYLEIKLNNRYIRDIENALQKNHKLQEIEHGSETEDRANKTFCGKVKEIVREWKSCK